MSVEFWQAVKGMISNQLSQMGQARHGIVIATNPNNATVRVQYDEAGTLSGWLPTLMIGTGNGMSHGVLPAPGTQVFVEADMGAMDHGVVMGAVHFSGMPMPQITPYMGEAGPVQPGVPFWIRGTNSMQLTDAGLQIRGPVLIDGDLKVSGQISDLNATRGTLDVLRTDYDEHDHHTSVGLTTRPTP